MKVISWNLLRLNGAAVNDLIALIERERPDLLFLQEATEQVKTLADIVGGQIHHALLPGRIHGLAVWTPHLIPRPELLLLPVSQMPGRLPPRLAQIVRINGVTFANVHLSHGQLLNRRQLNRIARSIQGPAAIIGDYNAVGPTVLPGFCDVGPREVTHLARNVIPFRLDRCLVRDLDCAEARALDRGPSDHCPIILGLCVRADVAAPVLEQIIGSPAAEGRNSAIRSLRQTLLRRENLPSALSVTDNAPRQPRRAMVAGKLIRKVKMRRLQQQEEERIGEP